MDIRASVTAGFLWPSPAQRQGLGKVEMGSICFDSWEAFVSSSVVWMFRAVDWFPSQFRSRRIFDFPASSLPYRSARSPGRCFTPSLASPSSIARSLASIRELGGFTTM